MELIPEEQYPKFQITLNDNGAYNWTFWSVNRHALMTENNLDIDLQQLVDKLYRIKEFVEVCNFGRQKHYDRKHYFYDQVSNDPFEVIHRSKLYVSMQAVERAIMAVQRDAPLAPVLYNVQKEL